MDEGDDCSKTVMQQSPTLRAMIAPSANSSQSPGGKSKRARTESDTSTVKVPLAVLCGIRRCRSNCAFFVWRMIRIWFFTTQAFTRGVIAAARYTLAPDGVIKVSNAIKQYVSESAGISITD